MKSNILKIMSLLLIIVFMLNTNVYAAQKINIGDKINILVGKLGDVNLDGKINSKDSTAIVNYTVGLKYLTPFAKLRADVNQDGKINSNDAIALLNYVTKQANTNQESNKQTTQKINVENINIECNNQMTVGDKQTVRVTITPSNATNKTVTFKSSNTLIATINSDGQIEAKRDGKTTITVTVDDHKAEKEITVKEKTTENQQANNTSLKQLSNTGVAITANESKFSSRTNPYVKSNGALCLKLNGLLEDKNRPYLNSNKGYKLSGSVASYYIDVINGYNPKTSDINGKFYNSSSNASVPTTGYKYDETTFTTYEKWINRIYNEIVSGYPVAAKVKNRDGKELYVVVYAITSQNNRSNKNKLKASEIHVIDTLTGQAAKLNNYYELKATTGNFILVLNNADDYTWKLDNGIGTNNFSIYNERLNSGGTFKLAVTTSKLKETINIIQNNNVCQSDNTDLSGRCCQLSYYYIRYLNGNINTMTVSGAKRQGTSGGIHYSSLSDAKNKIDNHQTLLIHVYNSYYQHWCVVVGYKNGCTKLSDLLLLDPYHGTLINMGTQTAIGLY